MNQSKKQKWIKAEHDKAVQIHWDNCARIRKLKEEQNKPTPPKPEKKNWLSNPFTKNK